MIFLLHLQFWFKVSLGKDTTEIFSLVDRVLLRKEEGWPELGSAERPRPQPAAGSVSFLFDTS